MTEINFDELVNGISSAPQIPQLSRRRAGVSQLGQTRTVLEAARLTADAEIRNLGLDETHGNPLDHILNPNGRAPLFDRLSSAISSAAMSDAFATPATTNRTPLTWVPGQRVVLTHRPVDETGVALPTFILVGSRGDLVRHQDAGDLGDGWQVNFDDHGTWWTPTYTLDTL